MTTRSTLISAAIRHHSARAQMTVQASLPVDNYHIERPVSASLSSGAARQSGCYATAGFGVGGTLPTGALPQLDAHGRELGCAAAAAAAPAAAAVRADLYRAECSEQCDHGIRDWSMPGGAGDPVRSDPCKPTAAEGADETLAVYAVLPGVSWAGADGGCAGKRSHTLAWEQALADFVAHDINSPACSTVTDDSPTPAGAAGLIGHGSSHCGVLGAQTQSFGWRRFCNPEVRGSNHFHAPYGPAHKRLSGAAASCSLSAPARARRSISATADC